MAKKRDYKAEYKRRIEHGLKQGLSRSQSRGHARPGEVKASSIKKPSYNRRMEEGLKAIRKGQSLSKAAESIKAAPKTLRKYIERTGVAKKEGSRWQIGTDQRPREMLTYSGGRIYTITVSDYDAARKAGLYMAAVQKFLSTNDKSVLNPFIGESVVDVKGKRYVFETRPNVLYRLNASETEPFEDVYRIVA